MSAKLLKINVFVFFGISNNDRIWNDLLASKHSRFQKSIVRFDQLVFVAQGVLFLDPS